MVTVKHAERLWNERMYQRLLGEMLANRPEAALRLELEECGPCRAIAAAAMGAIRLSELNQSHLPLQSKFLRTLIATQQSDGGWGDPLATTLALRALLCDRGQGAAIERGMQYLAMLQKPEGIWPKEPIRRMPADAQVSAFILYHLGRDESFRRAVRVDDALSWFVRHESVLDAAAGKFWERAKLRCAVKRQPVQCSLWS
jgi:hypothetical protein